MQLRWKTFFHQFIQNRRIGTVPGLSYPLLVAHPTTIYFFSQSSTLLLLLNCQWSESKSSGILDLFRQIQNHCSHPNSGHRWETSFLKQVPVSWIHHLYIDTKEEPEVYRWHKTGTGTLCEVYSIGPDPRIWSKKQNTDPQQILPDLHRSNKANLFISTSHGNFHIHIFSSSAHKRAHLVKDGEALLHPARGWGVGTVGVLGPVQHLLLYRKTKTS